MKVMTIVGFYVIIYLNFVKIYERREKFVGKEVKIA